MNDDAYKPKAVEPEMKHRFLRGTATVLFFAVLWVLGSRYFGYP